MEERQLLYNTLLQSSYWQVSKPLSRAFGIETAILLADLISKEKYFHDRGQLTDRDWFFNQQSQIEEDTTLSPHKQRKALDILKEQGMIETKLKGIPPLQYYKINHANILKILSYIDLKNKEHNNNKVNNTIINNSIEVSEETSKAKKSLSDKKEIKISDKAIDKYKVLIERWNGIGQATSHDTSKKSKTLKKIITLLQQLEAGTFFRYTGIDKKWCADNNVPVEWMDKKFTLSEISKGIRHMGQQFKPGFWPYVPEQKKKLPKSLAESLYNPYGGCASVFLKALANPPKEIEPLPENKYPQAADKYCEDFLGRAFEDLSVPEKRNIIKSVNAIMDWQKKQAETLCPIFASTSFSTYFGTKDKPNNFISTHINFLKNKGGIYSNKEPYHKNFKPTVSMLSPAGGRWQKFISDFSSVHGFDINPDKDKIRKLKIMYNN